MLRTDAECCIEPSPGVDCEAKPEHTVSVPRPEIQSTQHFFFCAEHWLTAGLEMSRLMQERADAQ